MDRLIGSIFTASPAASRSAGYVSVLGMFTVSHTDVYRVKATRVDFCILSRLDAVWYRCDDANMSTHAAVDEEFIPQWELGDRLRKVRRLMKMTQVAFARALDVEPETYAAWELGRNKVPDPVSIAKRVKMLSGTPIWWTLDTQESPHPAGPNGGVMRPTND